jgi:hypothetical protein
VRCQLDLFVAPLGGPIDACDECRAVNSPEVACHERVSGLRLIGSAFSQADVPCRVLLPRVVLEERVLVVGRRLHAAPVRVEHILPVLNEPLEMRNRILIHGI